MKIHFKIKYNTYWGQRVMIYGSAPELGSWDENKAIPLNAIDGNNGIWDIELEFSDKEKVNFEYNYLLLDENNGAYSHEFQLKRLFNVSSKLQKVFVNDSWYSVTNPDNVLYSSAFSSALLTADKQKFKANGLGRLLKNERIAELRLFMPRMAHNHRLGFIKTVKKPKGKPTSHVILMENESQSLWTAKFKVDINQFPIHYKYCIYDTVTEKIILWEDGYDRGIDKFEATDTKTMLIQSDESFRFANNKWKGTGVAIPVFSLRTKNSAGIGEFADIKMLVDWAKKTGLKMIQILPVNDTVATHSWIDSYPYAAISVFALHPIYLNLNAIGKLASKTTRDIIEENISRLNKLPQIDYEEVMRVKSRYFKHIYDDQKNEFHKDPDFIEFFDNNKHWLVPYAAFSYLRDLYGTADFSKWGKYSKVDNKLLAEITNPKSDQYDDLAIHYFIQYHLHKQLSDAADYARSNGIVLKGDIPIGIYRNSVDAWISPQLYNMSSQAGAPPDDFAEKGQNWRFPTYNWAEMQKDGYKWWRERLQKMADYFDAFRIDHILGFFRIWEIDKQHVEGILGHFNPAIPVKLMEFEQRGISFNYDRFCKPYIREHILNQEFGELIEEVKNNFLIDYNYGCYGIKPEFDTQRKVEEYLKCDVQASQAERMRNERIKKGLFNLLSEVLFLEAAFSNGTEFHPRAAMNKTRSFNELDDETKRKLHDLYIDFYYKRHEHFWHEQAMMKLPAIKSATNMLICGEDLGMVPECVPHVMNENGLLSLEIQRMPKNPKIKFGHPADFPYLSVATPSSHDMSTVRGWWEEDTQQTQKFYSEILGKWGEAPYFCEPEIVKDIITQHLYSPSMWAIFPLQDLLGIDAKLRLQDTAAERINVPSNPQHYWRYRFHIYLEDLLKEDDFNNQLLKMINESGRNKAY